MAIAFRLNRNGLSQINFGSNIFSETVTSIPVITLVGSAVTINQGDSYIEPGYSATDDNDGVITGNVVVTGSVNSSLPGVYTIRYNVTNSVGNAAAEVIRLVTVQDFWEYTPPQSRVIDVSSGIKNVSRDPDSTLSYWLDFSDLVGSQTIASVQVDPNNELDNLTVNCSGVNTKTLTDDNGKTYNPGEMIGFCISNGMANAIYKVLFRYTLSGGDIDDRTIVVHVIET